MKGEIKRQVYFDDTYFYPTVFMLIPALYLLHVVPDVVPREVVESHLCFTKAAILRVL